MVSSDASFRMYSHSRSHRGYENVALFEQEEIMNNKEIRVKMLGMRALWCYLYAFMAYILAQTVRGQRSSYPELFGQPDTGTGWEIATWGMIILFLVATLLAITASIIVVSRFLYKKRHGMKFSIFPDSPSRDGSS